MQQILRIMHLIYGHTSTTLYYTIKSTWGSIQKDSNLVKDLHYAIKDPDKICKEDGIEVDDDWIIVINDELHQIILEHKQNCLNEKQIPVHTVNYTVL